MVEVCLYVIKHQMSRAKQNTCLQAYADSEGQDQPVHPCSLSGHSLSANIIIAHCRMYQQMPEWHFEHARYESEYVHFAHVRRDLFAWRDPRCIIMSINQIYILHWFISFTHCSRETRKSVFGKHCRPRSDAAFCGVWSGSELYAKSLAIFVWEYVNLLARRN